MRDSVYNVVELIGTSTESWEWTAANAVDETARSHGDPGWPR
jgi:flavin-binding protein dodecin